jgi:hypothetical protein
MGRPVGDTAAVSDRQDPASRPAIRWLDRRERRGGLRPRDAAMLIVAVWLFAVVIFGIVEHLIDDQTFPTVWLGMWWALQTVTTVGYGDVVPQDSVGRLIASFLLLGGLALISVVTATITSGFVGPTRDPQRCRSRTPRRDTRGASAGRRARRAPRAVTCHSLRFPEFGGARGSGPGALARSRRRIRRGERPAEDEVERQWEEVTAEARSRWETLRAQIRERRRRRDPD